MKNSNFAQLRRTQKREFSDRVRYCEAQTEAARELLAKAEAQSFSLDFWREALEFAEAEEAQARRDFAQWQRRDQEAARRDFEFERALSPATTRALETAAKEAA